MRIAAAFLLGALAATAQTAGPRLAVALNGAGDMSIHQNWPALVRVVVRHPDLAGGGPAVRLEPAIGTWRDSLTLEVYDTNGNPQSWAFTPGAQPPEASLTLPPRSKVEPLFLLSSEQTLVLTPGQYAIRAVLNVAGGTGWTGRAVSEPVLLRVAAEPSTLGLAERLQSARVRAGWMLLTGDIEGARKEARALAADLPQSPTALRLAAEVFEQTGDLAPAFLHAGRALELISGGEKLPREPPAALIQMMRRLRQALLNSAVENNSAQP